MISNSWCIFTVTLTTAATYFSLELVSSIVLLQQLHQRLMRSVFAFLLIGCLAYTAIAAPTPPPTPTGIDDLQDATSPQDAKSWLHTKQAALPMFPAKAPNNHAANRDYHSTLATVNAHIRTYCDDVFHDSQPRIDQNPVGFHRHNMIGHLLKSTTSTQHSACAIDSLSFVKHMVDAGVHLSLAEYHHAQLDLPPQHPATSHERQKNLHFQQMQVAWDAGKHMDAAMHTYLYTHHSDPARSPFQI
jgi:hypothetical protein